ncbi:hypothetical protein SKAU_G00250820 [Synaphobranchus kaupii]|uniref:Uncharacterized protein n=1 Tax=Synaphobranchus kaupii TaxID=118154 RepID=A0A9Q1F373_SYNKA|nr:hypothetical protein SKAU_G00250820 [Synaphobranchus kaupii]
MSLPGNDRRVGQVCGGCDAFFTFLLRATPSSQSSTAQSTSRGGQLAQLTLVVSGHVEHGLAVARISAGPLSCAGNGGHRNGVVLSYTAMLRSAYQTQNAGSGNETFNVDFFHCHKACGGPHVRKLKRGKTYRIPCMSTLLRGKGGVSEDRGRLLTEPALAQATSEADGSSLANDLLAMEREGNSARCDRRESWEHFVGTQLNE